jgi:hypothetical protein
MMDLRPAYNTREAMTVDTTSTLTPTNYTPYLNHLSSFSFRRNTQQ